MTDQQTAATDNALVECLEAWGPLIASGYECPAAGQRIFEAAERIKSLQAEVERLTHDFTVVSTQYLKALDEVAASKADRQRMRDALEAIERAPAWGYPDKWETTPAEVRQLARAALNPASKEANDG